MLNRVLNREEFELIKKILGSTQEGLKQSMETFLSTVYKDRVVSTPEYLIAFGDIPVGLVAHLDTVHTMPVKDLFYDKEQNVMWSPQGIGADDRAGVFAIVEILKRGLRPTIILTTDEEIGGVGASKLVEDIPEAPCKLNFLIELDRRGSEDCVFYDCDNPFFEDYIEDFGFITNWGSFSDISYIAPKWGMAAVNLSIGYEHEHSKSEILNVSWMFNTIDKVCNILENVHEEDVFEYIPAKNSFQRYDIGYDYDPSFQEWRRNDEKELCWGCLGSFDKDMIIILMNGEGRYCIDCYNQKFSTCLTCGDDFKDELKVHLKCEKCRGEN